MSRFLNLIILAIIVSPLSSSATVSDLLVGPKTAITRKSSFFDGDTLKPSPIKHIELFNFEFPENLEELKVGVELRWSPFTLRVKLRSGLP